MSLLFAMVLKDSIVMASDSRTTFSYKDGRVTYVDTTYKTVIMDGHIGISHCRNASYKGKTISEHLYDFMEIYKGRHITRIPALLKKYFNDLSPKLDIAFFVAGYVKDEPKFYRIFTQGEIESHGKLNAGRQFWEGERTVPSKLFGLVYYKNINNYYLKHPDYKERFKNFDIYEAVRFIHFLYSTTEGYMSFFDTKQTVGGPRDILVIEKDSAYWYAKNENK